MDNLFSIMILAILIESIVQTVKPIWQPEKRTPEFFASLIVGQVVSILLTWLANLDLFSTLGVPLVRAPWVGTIFTGVLLSRGSQFIHDLFSTVEAAKAQIKNLIPPKV